MAVIGCMFLTPQFLAPSFSQSFNSSIFLFFLFSTHQTGKASTLQTGKASFYAKKATGSRTANGERLHHDSLTCAHRSYPFGTLLRVTNLLNQRQVVVRVNDRGPFRKGRIIDLSWGAAKEIGMISQGIVPVTVEKVSEAIIPLKPEDDSPEVPKFEFEIADIAVSGIEPVWRQDQLSIDHKKVQDSMKRTAERSADKASAQTDNIR